MKNELIKKEVEALISDKSDIKYNLKQIGYNDINYSIAQNYAMQELDRIENRIDLLINSMIE